VRKSVCTGKLGIVEVGPKYSIIIPSKNGMPYLQYAVKSVLNSSRNDLELVVSLDDVDDGSSEFLNQISDPRLKVITPPAGLSMSEHWDFAQIHVTGQWQMFLGQDDMMMTGFSDAFEGLTEMARQANLGVVVARRAYVCWPPLKDPNLKALQYWKTDELSIKNSVDFAAKALLTDISYHAGPQMYTTTLVAKFVVESIRSKNAGKLILGHPQDAHLAASLLKESHSYIYCGQPFSWVGTSAKSAGLAIAKLAEGGGNEIANNYVSSVANSMDLNYASSADFRHGVNSRYFFDALVNVWPELLGQNLLSKRVFRIKVDALILALYPKSKSLALDAKDLVTSLDDYFLKRWFSRFLRFSSKLQGLLIETLSKFLKMVRPRRLGFIALDQISNSGELFAYAMRISTSPPE
jgi:glycosyltransferase involved in cell wall biosynthesis